MNPQEQQFIEELQHILQREPGHLLTVTPEATFKDIYTQLETTFQELQKKYNLTENPSGTNTLLIMFKSEQYSKWYNENIYNRIRTDPTQLLIDGLEELFDNNTRYTYPDGKTIYYNKGRNTIPRIKRNILQEFNLTKKNTPVYKIRYALQQIEPRFS